MKKFFKALIALAIIAGLAFGVYMIFFNNKVDNGQIYAKVTTLNANETYIKVNSTVYEMLTDVKDHPEYELNEIQVFLEVFVQTIENYELVATEIENNGLFVNQTNTGDSYKQMSSAYESLISIYQNAQNYLTDTYFVNARKAYIEYFYNIFKNALESLNSFYYNAGASILKCLDNSFYANNHYKLEIEYCLNLNNNFVKHYLENKNKDENIVTLIVGEKSSIADADVNSYIENKLIYDSLYNNAVFNKNEVVEKHIKGELDAYLAAVANEEQKLAINNYCDLIVRG